MSALVPSKNLRSMVNDLVVKCEKSAQGCTWVGPLSERKRHLEACLAIKCERLGKEAEAHRIRCRAQERLLIKAQNENTELVRKNDFLANEKEICRRERMRCELHVMQLKQELVGLESAVECGSKDVADLRSSLARMTADKISLQRASEASLDAVRVERIRNSRLQSRLNQMRHSQHTLLTIRDLCNSFESELLPDPEEAALSEKDNEEAALSETDNEEAALSEKDFVDAMSASSSYSEGPDELD